MIHRKNGLTFIDVLISTVMIAAISSGSLMIYTSIINILNNSSFRSEAISLLNREVEIIKNLPYDQVGTQGGVPSGILLQDKTVSSTNNYLFNIKTTVRNIDDSFDGVLGGNPNDSAPADYKLVQMEINCLDCNNFKPLKITTTIAPKNLESATNDGSLFINVFDALGVGVSGAMVYVVNNSTTPTLNLTDTTNQSGMLQLVGVPTSTQNYHIEVSKVGYTAEQTYKLGDPENPNPIKLDATVIQQTVTQLNFSIDRVSDFKIKITDQFCAPVANQSFSIRGTKMIGIAPDIFKYSTTSVTDNQGIRNLNNIEWDSYVLSYNGSADILGTVPLSPTTINPSSTVEFSLIISTSSPNSLLVTSRSIVDNNGIPSSTIVLTKPGFSQTIMTGHDFIRQTDWSGGQYTNLNNIDTTSTVGSLKLISSAGDYTTSTDNWLISPTFDLGSTASNIYSLNWNPTSQPVQTGTDSIKFQISTNNDQTTWNFMGPDGTINTFYNTNGAVINSLHANNRYLRYKVFLKTDDSLFTPTLNHISIEFSGACVPSTQSLFNDLDQGSYNVLVSAIGFQTNSSTVNISNPRQQTDIYLSP